MKTKILNSLMAAGLFLIPNLNYAQAPSLGTAANFAIFTTNGEVKNIGISYVTHVTGNCGTNLGPVTGFGNVDGVMAHTADPISGQAQTDLLNASGLLDAITPTDNTLAPLLGSGPGQILTAGVYSISNANITLDQNLILDAQGVSSNQFIFQLHGAFSTNALSKVKLINGALACNVFWKIDGLVDMATKTSMKGTIISAVAINMATLDTLEGRALSIDGAITVSGVLVYIPTGCSSPVLSGPTFPTLASTVCYSVFTSSGSVLNTGITHVTGDIGTNGVTDSAKGYNPSLVTGLIHQVADASTGTCAVDLNNVYSYLNTLPFDIELLYPAEFGHNLVLTPHTYFMNAATTLTDTLYLNAQGNANAVFVIQITGAFYASTHSQIILTNGAIAKNVFWKVDGAFAITDSSVFVGTIISDGAIDLAIGVSLNGRALSIVGGVTTHEMTVTLPPGCTTITGIADKMNNENAISVFPNPFTNQIQIKINDSQINQCEFSLYTILGAEVMNTTLLKQVNTIETSNLPSGIYFYKVNAKNKTIQSGKLIAQ